MYLFNLNLIIFENETFIDYHMLIEISLYPKFEKAKIRFETAQELYVAAKRMQMYAEESLENHRGSSTTSEATSVNNTTKIDADYDEVSSDGVSNEEAKKDTARMELMRRQSTMSGGSCCGEENLAKMLQMAKIKASEAELAKQSSDIEQVVATQLYEEKKTLVEQLEKSLRKSIEKSRDYYELKAIMYKELRFLFTKIEGLKACLKEAKLTYQQSLKNLELISTEIHSLRQQQQNKPSSSASLQAASSNHPILISHSSSTMSSSSSSISFHDHQNQKFVTLWFTKIYYHGIKGFKAEDS